MAEILLGNIKGPKGERGKAFEFSDFTAEQLESLRGPKGDTGKSTKTVTVEFSTRPTYRDFGSDNGGMQVLGNVPAEYYGVLTAGDFVFVPMVHGEDGSDVIVVGEFVDYQYNSDGQGFGIIFKNLAAIKGSIGPSGKDGATFTPAVDSNGNLSWTNNGSLTNPANVNIKGPQGLPGKDGSNGKDGVTFTPTVDGNGTLSWSNNGGLVNPANVNLKGPKGDKGDPAENGVLSVNGITPDESGNVTIEVSGGGGGSGDGIPRTGNRGVLAGYETLSVGTVVNQDSPDFQLASFDETGEISAPITVENGAEGTSWVKVVVLVSASTAIGAPGVQISLGEAWMWRNMTAPTVSNMFAYGILVCVWFGMSGFAIYDETVSM